MLLAAGGKNPFTAVNVWNGRPRGVCCSATVTSGLAHDPPVSRNKAQNTLFPRKQRGSVCAHSPGARPRSDASELFFDGTSLVSFAGYKDFPSDRQQSAVRRSHGRRVECHCGSERLLDTTRSLALCGHLAAGREKASSSRCTEHRVSRSSSGPAGRLGSRVRQASTTRDTPR